MRKEYTFHSKEEKLGLVKRELLKKEAEVVRLKKSIELAGAISEESNSANLCARPAAGRTPFYCGALQIIQGIPLGVLQVAGTKRPAKLL